MSLSAMALEPKEYLPEIHGTFRGHYEYATEAGEGRFEVRNARVVMSGRIAEPIGYFFQVDLCDRGKFKVFDAYGWLNVVPSIKLSMGQLRIPFSVEASRAPHLLYFANRSFIGRTLGNYRGVGATIGWHPAYIPLLIEGGVFNSTAISDHNSWQKTMNYGAKIHYTYKNITAEAGFESMKPGEVRFNSYDASLSWSCGRWILEGEYLHRQYTHSSYTSTKALNIFGNYCMPIKAGIFNGLSFQARFDGATSASIGARDESGNIIESEPSRRRATIGATLSYTEHKVRADVRINFEKYFYRTGQIAPIHDCDRIVAELTVRF